MSFMAFVVIFGMGFGSGWGFRERKCLEDHPQKVEQVEMKDIKK